MAVQNYSYSGSVCGIKVAYEASYASSQTGMAVQNKGTPTEVLLLHYTSTPRYCPRTDQGGKKRIWISI